MKKHKAQITVFLSLILFCLAGLICATLESARLYGMKLQGANCLDLGLYSVFGEYNKELLKYYDVFFIDGAYGEEYQPEKLERRLADYMSYELYPVKEIEEDAFVDLWQMAISLCKVTERVCATDSNGIIFRNQAVDYITENLPLDDKKRISEVNKKVQGIMWSESNLNFDKLKCLIGEGENPLLPIEQLRGKSILKIIKLNQSISSKQINLGDTISYRDLGTPQDSKKELEIKGEKGEVLWQAYLLEKFNSYENYNQKSQKNFEHSVLDYELEYIIFGQKSDSKNLELVVNKIYQIRQEKNLNYLRNSQEKLEQVNSLALILSGGTQNPLVAEGMKEVLLQAWAYGESMKDISRLLQGNKVAFEKSDDTWKIQLSDLPVLPAIIQREESPDENGLNYEEYILMLLYLKKSPQQNIRSLDLIEKNIRQASNNNKIKLNHFVDSVNVYCEFQGEPVFIKMPFMKIAWEKIYLLKKKRGYSY